MHANLQFFIRVSANYSLFYQNTFPWGKHLTVVGYPDYPALETAAT